MFVPNDAGTGLPSRWIFSTDVTEGHRWEVKKAIN